jgi:hypothetical protein
MFVNLGGMFQFRIIFTEMHNKVWMIRFLGKVAFSWYIKNIIIGSHYN